MVIDNKYASLSAQGISDLNTVAQSIKQPKYPNDT